MSPKGQSFAKKGVQVSRRDQPQQDLLDLRHEAKNGNESKLAGFHLEIQLLEQAVVDANRLREQVEEARKSKKYQCESHHINISLLPRGQMVERSVSRCLDDTVDVNDKFLSRDHAAAHPQPDGVASPEAIRPERSEQMLPQAVGQQPNDIPEIMPQQVGSHLEIVGDVMAGHPSDNVFVPDVEAAHQAAAPSGYFSSSNTVGQQPNDIAGPNTDGPEIVPQQVDPDLDTVGDNGSTGFVQHHTESLQLDGAVASHPSGIASVLDVNDAKAAQHEAAHQHSDADVIAGMSWTIHGFGPLFIGFEFSDHCPKAGGYRAMLCTSFFALAVVAV
ncbi:hypothetical protein EDB85DRAFT_2153684 [Lactarius pseudohatsudake]|nr:hypothetical protein EDB85DRAFT_2153684 [Lactarius pseudohatsudake]